MPKGSLFPLPCCPPLPATVSPASTCLAAVSAPPLPGVLALWLLIAAHNSTSREVSRCPTHTMPAQWVHCRALRLSSCLRHLLLRLQLRLQTPSCRADCGFREQSAVRNFKGLLCLGRKGKGEKGAARGAGLQVHLRPLVRLFVPPVFLSWS